MTDAQKLEAIKAEIERRKNKPFFNVDFNEIKQFVLNELQCFIATLDEQSEEKLKEFNVEEYYKNPERKVVTRDGREVEILKINTKTKTNVPVIAMMDGNDIRFFTTNGRLSLERETCSDLFFADVDCDTTNDKGCVTCENGELYEGKPNEKAKVKFSDIVFVRADFFIDKACKWLKNNARNYYSAYATEDRLIEDFKKAMEEKQ